MEINRIGNKNCWIKIWFQHRGLINTAGLLILGDHLFLNYKKKNGQRGLINTAGIINPMLALLYIYMGKLYKSLTWKSETCGYLGDSPNPNHDCSEGEQWGRYNLPRSIVDYGPMMTNECQDICPETGSNQSWRLRSLSWGTNKKRAPLGFKPLSQTRPETIVTIVTWGPSRHPGHPDQHDHGKGFDHATANNAQRLASGFVTSIPSQQKVVGLRRLPSGKPFT